MHTMVLKNNAAFRTDEPLERAMHMSRVDLVVTDCQRSNEAASDGEGLQREFRCTIPLAILNGDIPHQTLSDAVLALRACRREPVCAEEFMQMIGSLVYTLQHYENAKHDVPAAQEDRLRVEHLTRRERQVLEHVVSGAPNKLTAAALNISRRTVEHHRAAIMRKTRTNSVSALVRLALRTGLYPASGADYA